MTSLAEEAVEQKRWIARAQSNQDAFSAVLANEFDTPEGQYQRIALPLTRMLRLAGQHVPHYRDLFRFHGIDSATGSAFEILKRMPILTRVELGAVIDRLAAEDAPEPRDRAVGSTPLAGSEIPVSQSVASARIEAVLKQREFRWARFDPDQALASIFSSEAQADEGRSGQPIERYVSWPFVAGHYRTGPHFAISARSAGGQIALLKELKPRYLLADAASVARLVREAPSDLVGIVEAVLVTSGHREGGPETEVARILQARVNRHLELPEIGPVAALCGAGRYHVHTENCHAEILDDAGEPVAEGESGRLVVTTLCNAAMPLLRYDSGQRATASDPHCPCGRTMPAFEAVFAR